ncbi:MAG TPA: glutathione S-transferase [Polyangiaceae bacterium]|jgi:glutathione S-transferase|nr:glutathione S-transferase [Polyangiaceae bacterium]
MLTVHHLNHSRSHRVLWLLEELGLEYEVKRYERDPETLRAPPALKTIHPLGKAPTVLDEGRVLAESGAVLETLLERYGGGRLAPARGTPERERYTYWMHYAEGSAMPAIVLRLIFSQMPRQPMPALARPVVRALAKNVIDTFVQPQIEQHLDYMESELARTRWFAGDEFTAADIQLSFPIETAAAGRVLDSRRSKLAGYLDGIRARPAYRRALDRGGPYDLSTLG